MKPKQILFLFFLAIFIGVPIGLGASADEIQTKIDQTKKKLSETKRREKSVLGSLLKTQQQLEQISKNLNQINTSLGTTERNINIIKNQLNDAEAELEKLKIEIEGRKGVLDQRLIAIYKYGYQSSLEILFNSQDFAEFITRFELLSNYIKGDLKILRALQKQQDIIAKKRAEIANKKDELENQKNIYARLQIQNKQQQSRQLAAIQNKQQELSILKNNRKALEDALDELEQTSKELEAQIRNYQNLNHIALGTGKYIWPVRGRITSFFGYRYHPILRKRRYHSGLDISKPQGEPILAADSGVVVFAARNGGYGKMIVIDHGSGISTVYAHCSLLKVDQGQTVTKGQCIGEVGSTGLSTGPHLHFEVRNNGVPQNPLSYLEKD